jgi:hypothetical protein
MTRIDDLFLGLVTIFAPLEYDFVMLTSCFIKSKSDLVKASSSPYRAPVSIAINTRR